MYILGMASGRSKLAVQTRMYCQNTAIPAVGGVNFAGSIRHSTGVPERPMRILGRYALAYVLHGTGRYADALGTVAATRPGDLIIVFPDVAHTYHADDGQRWDEFYIVFSGPVFDAWRASGLISPARPILHLQPIDYWLRRLESAAGESTGGDVALGLAGACRMQQLLADVVSSSSEPAEADRQWLARARSMIDADAASPESDLSSIASRLGVEYETFRKRFAKLAGISPVRYRNGRVMDRACAMLTDPTRTLRDVAELCGFGDEFHFSKRFKQLVGVSPSDFRKRLP
jgi:AraC-like DNA-binding protein